MSGAAAAAPPAVSISGVSFAFDAEPVLVDVDLVIEGNDFVGIVGPNGGGKTTLLQLILGLLEPQRGTVRVFGQPPKLARPRIGYVPQQAQLDAAVPADVRDVVLSGRLGRSSWGPRWRREDLEAADEALGQTDASELARRTIGELSGGQRQRVLIARALAADAELLLFDEPTSGVDLHRERALLELLHKLNERLPIVMVSHDTTLVASHLKTAVCVHRTVERCPANELDRARIEGLYHAPHPASMA